MDCANVCVVLLHVGDRYYRSPECTLGRGARDKQRAIDRVLAEWYAEQPQNASLCGRALASGKFGEIGRGEYQRWFSNAKSMSG